MAFRETELGQRGQEQVSINNGPSPKNKDKPHNDSSPTRKRESRAKEFAKGLVGVVKSSNNMMDYGLKNDMKIMQ